MENIKVEQFNFVLTMVQSQRNTNVLSDRNKKDEMANEKFITNLLRQLRKSQTYSCKSACYSVKMIAVPSIRVIEINKQTHTHKGDSICSETMLISRR